MTARELREAREAAGLSMKQAAELSGTPYRTWQSWETEGRDGRRPPGIAFSWLALWKARFEKRYGNQYDLIEQCKELIKWQE